MNGIWMLIYIWNVKFEVFYIVLFLNKFLYFEKLYDIIKKIFFIVFGSFFELYLFIIVGVIRLVVKIFRGLVIN